MDRDTFEFHKQYTVFHSARQLQDFNPLFGGGSAILIHDTLGVYNPVQLCANVPPETVAVRFDGALFGFAKQGVLVCSYLTPSSSEASTAYRNALRRTQLEALEAYAVTLRRDFEVVLVGDVNGWTGCGAEWNGEKGDPPYACLSNA